MGVVVANKSVVALVIWHCSLLIITLKCCQQKTTQLQKLHSSV